MLDKDDEQDDEAYDPFLDDEDEAPHPPHGVRFGEGQKRGRGRPAGSPNRSTIIKRVANKRHRIRQGDRVRSLSTLQLVMEMVRNLAAKGNLKAFDLQQTLISKFSPSRQTQRITIFGSGNKLELDEWMALSGEPYLSDAEVLERYPYLKHCIKGRRKPSAYD